MGKAGKTPEVRPKRSRKGGKNLEPKTPNHIPRTINLNSLHPSFNLGSNPPRKSLANTSMEQDRKSHNAARYSRLRLKAETALESLVVDDSCPPNVRAAAARTLLELVGAIGAKAPKHEADQGLDDSLEPESLSLADIDRELSRLS